MTRSRKRLASSSRSSVSSLLLSAVSVAVVLSACGSKTATPSETVVTPLTDSSATATTVTARTATATSTPDTLAPGETRLTIAQASAFSRVLVQDSNDGGASFVATIPYGPAATFTLTGDVDWKQYAASASLHTDRSDGAVQADQQMFWAQGKLVQPVPGLTEAMAAKGSPGITHMVRPLDPKSAPIDRVIVLINSMSNTRPENPILLRQRGDVAFAGKDELDGTSYDKYRYGSTTYWVDAAGGLGRVDAIFKGFAGPVSIRFTNRGPRSVTLPSASAVVDAASIQDVLKTLTSTSIAG